MVTQTDEIDDISNVIITLEVIVDDKAAEIITQRLKGWRKTLLTKIKNWLRKSLCFSTQHIFFDLIYFVSISESSYKIIFRISFQ
jgi:hypothetical protein